MGGREGEGHTILQHGGAGGGAWQPEGPGVLLCVRQLHRAVCKENVIQSLQTLPCKRHIFICLSRTSERAKFGGLPNRRCSFRVMYSEQWGRASSCGSRVHSSGWQTRGLWEGGCTRGERFVQHPLDNGLRTQTDLEQRRKGEEKKNPKNQNTQPPP